MSTLPSENQPIKNLKRPDLLHTMPKVKIVMVDFGDAGTLARFTYEPGFHYAEHVTPHLGGPATEDPPAHIALVLSGRLRWVWPDGREQEFGPDDTVLVPAWHGATRDAWVVGEEPWVAVTFLPGLSLSAWQERGLSSTLKE